MSTCVSIDMEKIKETFFVESDEHITSMETCILALEANPRDAETLNTIFRAAHSIKGNSGCLGFMEINSFTHSMETVLDRLRNGEIEPTGEIISLLLESLDCIKTLVDAAREGRECGGGVDATLGKLKALLIDDKHAAPRPVLTEARKTLPDDKEEAVETLYRIAFTPGQDVMKRGIDPINNLMRQLASCGKILKKEILTANLPDIADIDPEACYLSWEIWILTSGEMSELAGVFDFVKEGSLLKIDCVSRAAHGRGAEVGQDNRAKAGIEPDKPAEADNGTKMIGEILIEEKVITPSQLDNALKKQKSANREESSTIRVDTGKVDKLVNLVGELVIAQSMISQLSTNPSPENSSMLQTTAVQLERSTREIQERVMAIRMLPIGTVFNRFIRLVRDLSGAKGKKVVLKVSGEDTELDKTVIEKISDPLTHLIRNAIDHGIETPDDRKAKGKPEEGVVKLSACHGGGYIIVTVEDDGRGLDKEKIVKKAVEKGLIEGGGVHNMTDSKIYDLIFLPGFSTADIVTDLSGRGVGMDVVKRNIVGLGGSVSVESERDVFARITLKIPLTLAIIDGLSVLVGEETFIVPVNSVFESLRPKKDDVKFIKGEGEVVNIRGSYVPLIRLHRFFKIQPKKSEPWECLVVVVSSRQGRYAIMVDELTGEQQAVIKSIGEGFKNLLGIAGATILGDGRVALIIDVEGVVRIYHGA